MVIVYLFSVVVAAEMFRSFVTYAISNIPLLLLACPLG